MGDHVQPIATSGISTAGLDFQLYRLRGGPFDGLLSKPDLAAGTILSVLYFPERVVVKGDHASATYLIGDAGDDDELFAVFEKMG